MSILSSRKIQLIFFLVKLVNGIMLGYPKKVHKKVTPHKICRNILCIYRQISVAKVQYFKICFLFHFEIYLYYQFDKQT